MLRLRGRDAELRALDEHVAALAQGRGGVVVVHGPAGIGKSSLLAAAASTAERNGIAVHHGGGDPAARAVPLHPLLNTLLTGSAVLDTAALRDLASVTDSYVWTMREIQDRLEQAALRTPRLIVIDDLQWGDDATLLALQTLPRRLASHAIGWLLALRSDDAPKTVERLCGAAGLNVGLGPLEPSAVAQAAEDILAGVPGDDVLAYVDDVRGQPFLLLELLRGLQEEGQVRTVNGSVSLIGGQIPRRFSDAIAARLGALSDPARSVVEMASVLGRRFSAADLSWLLQRPAHLLIEPLQEALAAQLLVEHGQAFAFRHDLIREAVDAGLPAPIRLAMRRQAVGLMLEHDVPPLDLAPLLLDAAEPGDRRAVDALRRGAAEIASTATQTAAVLSQHALALTAADDPVRVDIVAETVPLVFAAGHPAEAQALAATALDGRLDPVREATMRLELAQLDVQHSFAEVGRQCRQALALPDLPDALRLALNLTQTLGCLMNGDFEDAAAAVDDDLAAARASGNPACVVAALNSRSALDFHRHAYQRAIDGADEALEVAAAGGPDAHRLWPDVWPAWVRGAVGLTGEALQRSRGGLDAAQREGRASDVRFWLACRCRILLTAGRLQDARAEAEAVLELDADLGHGGAALTPAGYVLGCVAVHTGDRRAQSVAAGVAAAMRADESINLRRNGAWLGALLADARGDLAGALELLRDTLDALGSLSPTLSNPQDPFDIVMLLRLVARSGDHKQADRVATEIERRAGRNPGFALQAALGVHARGLVDRDADAMRSASASLAQCTSPVARAALAEDLAEVLSSEHRAEAVAELDAALERYVAAGATHDAARVRLRLRSLGVRRRRSVPQTPPKGWRGLTESESAVVELVASGATNRQVAERLFLSTHTVSSHLRHAFLKLGIRSRVELAAMYAARSPEPVGDTPPADGARTGARVSTPRTLRSARPAHGRTTARP